MNDSATRRRSASDDDLIRRFIAPPEQPTPESRSGPAMFRTMLTYIMVVGEVPPESLHDVMKQVGPDAEEIYVTTADMLRAEGEARGRAEALMQLLALRFGPVPDAAAETVRDAPTERIEAWTARVLTAGSLEDVLR